jgi:Tol biopolymer transport system component
VRELKELFDMVTSKTEPDLDAWREQEERQRKRANRRRGAAFAVAAVVAGVAIVAAVALRDTSENGSAATPTPAPLSANSDLVAFDVATGQATPVIEGVASFRPAVSPDGSQIAFLRSVKGHSEIFVADIDGAHVTQITGRPGQIGCGCGSFDPTWSPDGAQIAFSGTSVFGDRGIYLVTLATGRVTLRTDEGGGSFEVAPAWSPVGDRIAFATGSWKDEPAGSGSIVTMRSDGAGNGWLQIAQQPGATDPTWSPDGRRLVFAANVHGGTSLFVAGPWTARDPKTHALVDGAEAGSPAWSPDGTQVAFVQGNEVAILTLDTGEIRVLGTGGDPAWSPDGHTIYAWQA